MLQILLDLNLSTGHEYFTNGPRVIYDSKQWCEGMLLNIDNLSLSQSERGVLQTDSFKLLFNDSVFNIKSRDDNDFVGSAILHLYNTETESATQIAELNINKHGLENGLSIVECSNEKTSVDYDYLYITNKREFTDMPDSCDGKVVCFYGGNLNEAGEFGTGRAINVEYDDGIVTGDYLFTKLPTLGDSLNTLTGNPITIYRAGIDITADCSFNSKVKTIDGIQYEFAFINDSTGATEEDLTFTYEIKNQNVVEMMKRIISMWPGCSYDSDNLDLLNTFCEKRLFWISESAVLDDGEMANNLCFVFNVNLKGFEILELFFKQTGINYIFINNVIYFFFPDLVENEVAFFNDTEITVLNYMVDRSGLINNYNTRYSHDGNNGFLSNANFQFLDTIENQSVNGVKNSQLDLYFTNNRLIAYISTKHNLIENMFASTYIEISGQIEKTGILKAGDIVKISSVFTKNPESYYRVIDARYDFSNNYTMGALLKEVVYRNLDVDCKLLIHSWIDNSTEFWNDAADSDCEILSYGSIDHQTQAGALGGCLIGGDGSTRYLKVTDIATLESAKFQAPKWDVLQYENYTIFFELKLNSVQAGIISIIGIYKDGNNRIAIRKAADHSLNFAVISGGSSVYSIVSNANDLNNTSLHQYCFVKVGDESGLYIDGVQVAYLSDSSTDSILGDLYILQRGDGAQHLDGNIGEIYFSSSNIFGAVPNVAKTDTIQIKVNPFSWTGLNE